MTLYQNFNFMTTINNFNIPMILVILFSRLFSKFESSAPEVLGPGRDSGPQHEFYVLTVLEVPSTTEVFQAWKCMERRRVAKLMRWLLFVRAVLERCLRDRWRAITCHGDFFGAHFHGSSVVDSRNEKQPFPLTSSAVRGNSQYREFVGKRSRSNKCTPSHT